MEPNETMPTVLRSGPFRFFFYSDEGAKAPHIHVQEGRKLAKFWLDPVRLASSKRFNAQELRTAERIVEANSRQFVEAWHEFFNA